VKIIKRLTDWFGLHPMAGDSIGAFFLAQLALTNTLGFLVDPTAEDDYLFMFPDTGLNQFLMTVWGLAYAVPLIWRRTRPALACTLLVIPHLVQLAIMPNLMVPNIHVPIMLFAIAAYGSDRARKLWLLLGIAAAMAAAISWTYGIPVDLEYPTNRMQAVGFSFVVLSIVVFASWLLGAFTRERVTTIRTLKDRADAVAAERDRFAQLAAEQERSRIAREMHDVVAHSLSVIVVQTDGAVYALDQPGDDAAKLGLARAALERIAATSREALRETRELVGVLREGEAPEMAPQPGLDEIEALISSTRSSGLGVDYAVDGSPAVHSPLSPGREAAAYRIVQESLTNVIKHAGPGAHAWVHLSHTGEGLTISVRDDGLGVAENDGHGHGLIGMRERVAPYGGTITARPRLDGGFEVLATIPAGEATEMTSRLSDSAPDEDTPTLMTRITDLTRKNA